MNGTKIAGAGWKTNRRDLFKAGGALVLLQACGGPTAGPAGGPDIAVGATVPLTGSASALGDPMAKALQITTDDINKAGGPLGRKIKMYVEDDQTDPGAATRAVQRLLSVNQIVALLGGNGSSVVLAQLPLTIDAGILDINEGGAPEITGPKFVALTFRTQSSLYYYAIAHYAKDNGLKNVSVMRQNITFAQVVMDQFVAEWTKLGMTPAKDITYNPNQPSYAGELQKALESKPDLLIILGYAADTTIIVKEFYTTGSKTPVMGLDFAMNTQFVSAVGNPAANGLIKIGPKLPIDAAGFKAFEARFNTETKLQLSDYPNAAQTHDQINLVALAIEAGKSTKGADLARYLREVAGPAGEEVYDFATGATLLRQSKKINYQGASGPCDFDNNHNVAADFGAWRIDAQGIPQLVKTYKASEILP